MELSEWNNLAQIVALVIGSLLAVLWFILGSHISSLKVSLKTARTALDDATDLLHVEAHVENPSSVVLTFDTAVAYFIPRAPNATGDQLWSHDLAESQTLSSTARLKWNAETSTYDYGQTTGGTLNITKDGATQFAACQVVPSNEVVLVDVRIGASLFRKSLASIIPRLAREYRGKMQWSASSISTPTRAV